jgi:hypothetical protein
MHAAETLVPATWLKLSHVFWNQWDGPVSFQSWWHFQQIDFSPPPPLIQPVNVPVEAGASSLIVIRPSPWSPVP